MCQKPNVKFFRVYTYLRGAFNLGFAKMTNFCESVYRDFWFKSRTWSAHPNKYSLLASNPCPFRYRIYQHTRPILDISHTPKPLAAMFERKNHLYGFQNTDGGGGHLTIAGRFIWCGGSFGSGHSSQFQTACSRVMFCTGWGYWGIKRYLATRPRLHYLFVLPMHCSNATHLSIKESQIHVGVNFDSV